MELKIKNKAEIDRWLSLQMSRGRTLTGIKGTPPQGAVYSDGSQITRPVNVGWRVNETGEKINILYQEEP